MPPYLQLAVHFSCRRIDSRTTYVYKTRTMSRTMYMSHELWILYTFHSGCTYDSRTMYNGYISRAGVLIRERYMYMSHTLCITATNYVFVSQTMYNGYIFHAGVSIHEIYMYMSHTMHKSHELCIYVTNYVQWIHLSCRRIDSRKIHVRESHNMHKSHELCVCVTNYI